LEGQSIFQNLDLIQFSETKVNCFSNFARN
jgi:hypothetical protein